MRVTQRDIAARCGVSNATVSLALRHDPQISEETIERIHTVAAEMGYVQGQNQAARRLALQRFGRPVINHVIAAFFSDEFYRQAYSMRVYRGILETTTRARFALLTATFTHPTDSAESHVPAVFTSGEVDGIITHAGTDAHFYQELSRYPGFRSRPVVSFYEPVPGCACVRFDDEQGSYQAARHLLELGHRHLLLCITRELWADTAGPRVHGVQRAMAEMDLDEHRHLHLLEVPVGWIHPDQTMTFADMPRDDGELFPGLLDLLCRHPEVTAILARNDSIALRAWHDLTRAGYRIPEDYSLVGYDDYTDIPDAHGENILTTVHVPLEEMGRQAAQLLIDQTTGERTTHQEIVLPVELLVRASTAPPR
jgi:DNA-binding LacI/PurR family transcriptional regulator